MLHNKMRTMRSLLFILLLLGLPAHAANYTFPGVLPAGCLDNGGGSYACGALSLAAGDTVTIAAPNPATITFSGAFGTDAGVFINEGGNISNLSLVVNGAVTLGAGSLLNANLKTLGAGAVTIGADSWISGNVSTETGFVSVGAATIPPPPPPAPQQTGVGGNVSTITGYVSMGAGSVINGSLTTQSVGYVVLGASAKVSGSIATLGAGYVTLGASAQVSGSITASGTTGADYVTTGAGSVVGCGISTAGSYIVLGASTQVSGNVSTKIGYITVGATCSVGGQVSMNDPTPSYISIGAGSRVYAVCCNGSDASCVSDGSGITPGPSVCAVPGGSTGSQCVARPSNLAGNFECLEAGASYNNLVSNSSLRNPLYTKLAGKSFTLDLVALKTDGTLQTTYASASNKSVSLELVDGSGAAACAARTVIAPAGSQTLTFSASDAGRKTAVGMIVNNAYTDLRCRITDANQTPSVVGCSSDNFAVRPATFVMAQNTPTLNAGSTFSLQATAVNSNLAPTTNYTAVPALNLLQITGVPGFISTALLPQTFSAAINGVSSATFTYDEIGSFTLPATSPGTYGISDSTSTSVDGSTDCVASSAVNTLDGSGKYGCLIGQSAALTVGRFYPDHFDITPAFTPGCVTGGFTYMDQPFTLGYTVTAKSMSRTAPNPAGNLPLTLYSGGKLNFFALNAGTDWVTRLIPTVINPLTPTWSNGSYTPTSTGTTFTRPSSLQDASWGAFEALNIGVAVDDADGVGYTASIPTFDGTTPTSCTKSGAGACRKYASLTGGATAKMRFGRIKLSNAYGSERLNLQVPIAFEYWTVNGWVKNSLDTCTVLSSSHFTFAFPVGTAAKPNNLAACDSALTVTGSAPTYGLSLSKPSSGKTGWADVTLNLGAMALGPNTTCTIAGGTGGADVPANMPWLQYNGGNPKARATFGVFKSPLIYRRENY